MFAKSRITCHVTGVCLLAAAVVFAQPPQGAPPPESVRQAQELLRDGKLAEAQAAYRKAAAESPASPQVNNAAGVAFDLMGKSKEGQKYFQKAIELSANPQAKAQAQRAMAMSFAFEGDCANAGKYEQMVIDYWVSANSPE
jgi:Flp pilus assembly protein TadD